MKDHARPRGPIVIGTEAIRPGEYRAVMLPMPQFYDCSATYMPVHVFHGEKEGPVLTVLAALHGDEINGTEIIRRLIKMDSLRKLQGTLIAIPVVNVYGFIAQSRYLADRRDLNRSFPGSEKGSLAARLCHLLLTEIISKSTHVIDLHTGSLQRTNVPQIRVTLSKADNKKLAQVFDAPIILDAREREGTLRGVANDRNISMLVYEGGEALRFDEFTINTGVKGILNILSYLNMTPASEAPVKMEHKSTIANSSHWIRASHSGMLILIKKVGDHVAVGEPVAIIANPMSIEEFPIASSYAGFIIGQTNAPLIHEGEAILHVASVDAPHKITQKIAELFHHGVSQGNDEDII
jgi:uncharacterized protein